MRSKKTNSAAAVFVTMGAFLIPAACGSQEVVDLPAQDQPLAIGEEEIFSVGSMAGEEWETFARVEGVAFDAEGNLYILDAQNSRVVKVGPQGQFITAVGRSGEGPGEFTRPLAFSVTRSGEIRVFDLGHHGFTVFNPDGSLKSTARLPGSSFFIPNGGLMSLPNGNMVDGGRSPVKLQAMTSGGTDNEIAPRPVNLFTLTDEARITTAYQAWNPLSAIGSQKETSFSGGGIQMTGTAMRAFDADLFVGIFPNGRLAVCRLHNVLGKGGGSRPGRDESVPRPLAPREVSAGTKQPSESDNWTRSPPGRDPVAGEAWPILPTEVVTEPSPSAPGGFLTCSKLGSKPWSLQRRSPCWPE